MNNTVQDWLASRAAPPGVVACGLRQPDGNYICHSADESCPVEKMEKILGQFHQMRATLFTGDFLPRWNTWTFERARIRFVEHPDGWLLGLIVRTECDPPPDLDALSNEFLSIKFG